MKEYDIRPKALFDEYLRLSTLDAQICFDEGARVDIPCIGCGSLEVDACFMKNGFQYAQCRECGSVYQSPRPDAEAFEKFYENSISSNYWANVFFPAVAEARREKIFHARALGISEICERKQIRVDTIVDVGAGYGIFLEEWQKLNVASRLVAIEPSASLSEVCREKGFEVIPTIAEKAGSANAIADLVVCFEVLEHVSDPLAFLQVLRDFVRPGGYLLVSTLGIDGFDIQVLWEDSKSISPPHHINFFSRRGFETVFRAAGMKNIEITTPGLLDVDIVKNSLTNERHQVGVDRFLYNLVSDPALASAFQMFLIENKLSSHTWILAQRPS